MSTGAVINSALHVWKFLELDDRGQKERFIGYVTNRQAFILWDVNTEKTVFFRNVIPDVNTSDGNKTTAGPEEMADMVLYIYAKGFKC